MKSEWAAFSSPFGRGWVELVDGEVVRVSLSGRPPKGARRSKAAIARKIERCLAGGSVRFDDRVRMPGGSPFARRVYAAVRAIPRGETRTYGEIARAAGRPRAARAVGQLMARNPLVLIIPCHRVTAAGGRLGGFSGGLHRKRRLLALERR